MTCLFLQRGWWQCGLVVLVGLVLAGCGKDAAKEAGDSDTNGYLCRKCSVKFYTERKVFAEYCPGCKSADIRPVVGYLCSKDNHTTLTTQAHGSILCEQCQAPVSATRLPREADLKTWGAAKKTRAEVAGN